ncbi:MAG: GTP-binding protein [Verrucomicrobiota bacterium]
MSSISMKRDVLRTSYLLTDQVEFADVIIVNTTDLVTDQELEKVMGHIRALNQNAEVIKSQDAQEPLKSILATGKFDFEKAAQSPM